MAPPIFAGLRRITSRGAFIPVVDGLRFLAIFSVVLFHTYGYLRVKSGIHCPNPLIERFLVHGDRGVRVFFCLSGFMLGLPFAQHRFASGEKPRLSAYFRRRLTRLEPPYLLNVIICGVLTYLLLRPPLQVWLPHLSADLFYLNSLLYGTFSLNNPVLWSLAVEVQFYLLLPVLQNLYRIRNTWARRTVFLLVICASSLFFIKGDDHFRIATSLLYFLPFFFSGMLLAELYVFYKNHPRSFAWDAVTPVGLALVFLSPANSVQWLLPFAIPLVFAAGQMGRLSSRLYSSNWLTIIGGMCYSIYLFHYQVISAVGRISRPILLSHSFWTYFLAQTAILAAAILLLCGLFFVSVERPCMQRDWPERLANWISRSAHSRGAAQAARKRASNSR